MKVDIEPYPDNDTEERQISVEIEDWDVWDADDTLAHIIHPVLKRFAESEIGTPSDLKLDEWKCALQKMITSFEMIKDRDCFYSKENTDKIQEGINLFAKYYLCLWN